MLGFVKSFIFTASIFAGVLPALADTPRVSLPCEIVATSQYDSFDVSTLKDWRVDGHEVASLHDWRVGGHSANNLHNVKADSYEVASRDWRVGERV